MNLSLYLFGTCCTKRVRFTTSVLFVASIGLELLTPTFPQCFLLLATIANISKQISLACYLATRVRIKPTTYSSLLNFFFSYSCLEHSLNDFILLMEFLLCISSICSVF